jgi:uncharacterized membrane-anchored protein
VGDFFTMPIAKGGLGLGTYDASAVLLMVLGGLTARMALKARRRRHELAEHEHRMRWRGGRVVTDSG